MRKVVDYVIILEDGVRKRHHHETEKNKVTYFAVQLEVNVGREWKVVIRYDCAHGFAHLDKYNLHGQQTKLPLGLSFENALTYGDWDISEHWQQYVQDFLKGAPV